MTIFIKDKEFDEMKDHVVIGHYQGKAIVKDETDALFFVECEGDELPVGITLFDTELRSISELVPDEQEAILEFFE